MQELLKHNNTSMKTEVETFFIEETTALIYDNEQLDQWNKLVTELGLQGQTNIVKDDKSPIPFLWMNTALICVFEELCPRKSKVEEYNKTPIPVEALGLVSLSKNEGYFDKIEVWYNDANPDPAIIGYKFNGGDSEWQREWKADKYLLARWSDVKASLEQLTQRAKALFVLRQKNDHAESIKRYQRALEDVEAEANKRFGFAGQGGVDLPF